MLSFNQIKIGIIAISLAAAAMAWAPLAVAVDKSDLNFDQSVDVDDLVIFSTNYLDLFWEDVDWCQFYEDTIAGNEFEGRKTKYYKQHFTLLLAFINTGLDCGDSVYLLDLENEPKFLTRIARSPNLDGDFYITDPRVGSLFIYGADLVLKAEIKGLNKPLGVTVDSLGYILIGNSGSENIEVYDPADGTKLIAFGEGQVLMPTAITIGPSDEIYVTDSKRNAVLVFNAEYQFVRSIGKSGIGEDTLGFPTDSEVVGFESEGQWVYEVFVADQGNNRVQVFDVTGNWLRSITFEGTEGEDCNWFTGVCAIPGRPPFTRLQALDVDSLGRLHVLDNFAASVHVFDSADGTYLESYGEYGIESGFLRVPMDVLVTAPDAAMVTSGSGDRIETFAIQ